MVGTGPAFVLRTLGLLQLEQPGEPPVVVQRAGKPLALLAYLAAGGGRPVTRAAAADLLWGDESPESARASLRQAIHALRKLLGEAALPGDRHEVHLAPGAVEADHTRLLHAVAAGDVDAIVHWYRGPFCAALELRSAPTFERWAEAERERLRRLVTGSVQREVAAAIASGEVARAATLARALHAAEPALLATAELAADALVAAGAFGEARAVLETARTHALADEGPEHRALEQRLAQLDRPARAPAERRRARPFEPGQRFVGREDVLGRLFQALEDARAGTTTRLILSGPAGMGKSRVLDEFESRVRPRGARVARVRFIPAMRAIPWSGLAEFARALGALPGALGVRESTAAVLVELLPELRAQFPSAPQLALAPDGLAQARAAAIADLAAAVSEDRLTILLRDDDHNVDSASAIALSVALERADLRLLDVRTTRQPVTLPTPGTTPIVLAPLAPAEVRGLLEASGLLPEAPWVEALVARLTASAAGVPQLLVQRVRALGEAGLLRLEDGRWAAPDPSALLDQAGRAPELDEVLGALRPLERAALQLLAHWRRPMRELDLLVLLAEYRRGGGDEAVREALADLEMRGFLVVREDGWAVAHETIAESALASQSVAEAEDLQYRFVRHFTAPGNLSVPMLEHLALLCGARDLRLAAERLVRQASADRQFRRGLLSGRALAARVAAAAGRPEWTPALQRSVGFWRRRSQGALVGIGSLAGAAVATVVWLAWMLWPRLVVEAQPLGEGEVGGIPGSSALVVQPRIGVFDGFGRRLDWFRGEVRVRSRERLVSGDTSHAVQEGHAQFENLALAGLRPGVEPDSGAPEVVFSAPWARDVSTTVPGAWLRTPDDFRVVRVEVNGLPLDSALRVRVPTGDSLRVALTFQYSTGLTTANYVVGAAPTWLPHEHSTIRLAGLPRPVRNAWQTVYFSVPGPQVPGVHHIVVLKGAEDSVDHLFSLTGWAVGAPVWNDGNDVQDLTAEQLQRLRQQGRLSMPVLQVPYRGMQALRKVGDRYYDRPRGTQTGYVELQRLGTAIEVVAER